MQSNRVLKFFDRFVGIPICILLSIIKYIRAFLDREVEAQNREFQSQSASVYSIDEPKKILFIQLSALGDTILAIPTVRAIRCRYPNTELSFLASPTNLSYLERCPYIDRKILFRSPLYQLIQTVRREHFDWVIDLEHWSRFSVLLAYGTGASRLIGFTAAHQYRHYLFNDTVPHIPGKHEVLNFLSIAHELGCNTDDLKLDTWIDKIEEEWCRSLLVQKHIHPSDLLIVLHPEAGRRGEPRRRWSLEKYVVLADTLSEQYNARIVLTGAPNEVTVSEWIAERTKCETVVLAGQTQVNQLAALFVRANLVVCGNCGPMHLAAAAGTPIVAIHGPTNSKQWGPWTEKSTYLESNLPCSPCLNLGFEYACQALPDGTSPCMHTISVKDVLRACDLHLVS